MNKRKKLEQRKIELSKAIEQCKEYKKEIQDNVSRIESEHKNKTDKTFYDMMVKMVDQMLELQKKYHSAKIETEKNLFKKQIDILDKQIDRLVYELYQLTGDEIKIIEQDTGEKR